MSPDDDFDDDDLAAFDYESTYCLNCGCPVDPDLEFCSRICEDEYESTYYGLEERSPKDSEW